MAAIDPKKMALQIAGLRAYETRLPEGERVFHDPYAEHFFDEESRRLMSDLEFVRTQLAQYEQMMPGVNGAIVARIRFMDEFLAECLSKDFEQVVTIGAGFDSRAHRVQTSRDDILFFEVDHPETQAIKTQVMNSLSGLSQKNVKYVPVVFGSDRLDQKLLASGYDPKQRTLFIAEGLLMYIPPAAVDGLLGFIKVASGPGSALTADYFNSDVIDGTSPLVEAQNLKKFVESEGSALQFGLPENEFNEFFQSRGFEQAVSVAPNTCKSKYFPAGSVNRAVSPMFNFLIAETPMVD